MPRCFTLELDKPVRFLALEWREDWEFDHPTVLLEPVVRYSPNGVSGESIMEDAMIDLALAAGSQARIQAGLSYSEKKEFDWRGWSLKNLKRVAAQSLAGKEFPVRGYHATEHFVVFTKNDRGEIEIHDHD